MATKDASQRSLPLDEPYRNEGLFADNYLEHRLEARDEWQESDGLEEALATITDLYEDRASHFTPDTNESQTEEYFIKPILKVLGWEYEPQQPIAAVNRTPDYALLTSREEWEAIQELKGAPELWQHCVAVGDAKRWQQDLGRRRDGENPTLQITNYLFRSRVRWGILTNGRKWRLYERERSSGGGIYYEVDLLNLLDSQDLEAFKYFYLFFRKDAFVPVRDGKSFVEIVYESSERYRTKVGDSLKEAVYDALRNLMNGFFRYQGNDLDPNDSDQLQQVHDLALVVLYRLLFLLYAEDGELLPATQQPYADYSMLRLQKQVNSRLRSGASYSAGVCGLWHDLLDRFQLIDQGRDIIPAYNGGLFSCARYPEIAYELQSGATRWEIGDSYLAEAIDLLAYKRQRWDEPGTSTVDYATLGVQHLGAIYEGLLELKPQVAAQPMIEQSGASGKAPVVKKKSEVKQPKKVKGQQPREFAAGEIYLVTDRGERKATGSYYTPKYIVDYIVENTVGPLADEAAQKVRERWEQLAAELGISEQEQLDQLVEAAEQEWQRRELEEKNRWLLEPYLDLKILDPAMGSGHFLVGAADHLSLAMATDPCLPPVPPEEESDVQTYYKRLIVEHCLYGVDLNPLAVELAKLSLWLHTVSKDKALSFLDHHLRCGNSLIGARLQEDLSKPPPQVKSGKVKATVGAQLRLPFDEALRRNDLVAFLDTFRQIVEAPTGQADIERQKDKWFREMDKQRDRYRQVANLWLAPYFGVKVTADEYGQALEALRDGAGSEEWQSLSQQGWFQTAQEVAGERRFFHWELEFPEAFFTVQDTKADWKPEEGRGFNAVIGNPPYGAELGDEEITICDDRLLHDPTKNSSNYFMALGTRLAAGRASGMIVPKSLTYSPGWDDIREHIVANGLRFALDVSQAFPDVELEQVCIGWGDRRGATLFSAGYAVKGQIVEWSVPANLATGARLLLWFPSTQRTLVENVLKLSVELGQISDSQRGPDICRHLCPAGPGVPIVSGAAVGRYSLTDLARVDRKWLPQNAQDQWQAPKLLAQEIVGRIGSPGADGFRQIAINSVVDTEGLPFVTTVVRCKPNPPVREGYICACMNSMFARFFIHRYLWNRAQLTLHLGNKNIRNFLIRFIDFDHATDETRKKEMLGSCGEAVGKGDYQTPLALAKRGLATHAALYGPAGKPELKEDPYWQEQIAGADPDFLGREDFVHDLLAELAQRMIDLNKEKHQLIEKFETDLRGAAAEEVHEKLKKGKQGRSLYKHEACRSHVQEGSGSTHHLPETLAWSDAAFEDFLRELVGAVSNLTDFLDVYCRYADQYRQVTEALEKTDHLIDQIVYALYGLSEEEIAIVEERT